MRRPARSCPSGSPTSPRSAGASSSITSLVVILWLLCSVLWTVTASIAVAIVIAAFFAPFALRLRARGRSRAAAAAIVWVVALAVLSGALLLLAVALAPYVIQLANQLEAAVDGPPVRPRRPPRATRRRGPRAGRAVPPARRDRRLRGPARGLRGERRDGGGPRGVPGVLLPQGRRQGVGLAVPGRRRGEARADHRGGRRCAVAGRRLPARDDRPVGRHRPDGLRLHVDPRRAARAAPGRPRLLQRVHPLLRRHRHDAASSSS